MNQLDLLRTIPESPFSFPPTTSSSYSSVPGSAAPQASASPSSSAPYRPVSSSNFYSPTGSPSQPRVLRHLPSSPRVSQSLSAMPPPVYGLPYLPQASPAYNTELPTGLYRQPNAYDSQHGLLMGLPPASMPYDVAGGDPQAQAQRQRPTPKPKSRRKSEPPMSVDKNGYAFIGTSHKRPRRRYEQIERLYACNYPDCTKAYGTLNHLNAHVFMQKHGEKRTPEEFKTARKEWKARKQAEAEAEANAIPTIQPTQHQQQSQLPHYAVGPMYSQLLPPIQDNQTDGHPHQQQSQQQQNFGISPYEQHYYTQR